MTKRLEILAKNIFPETDEKFAKYLKDDEFFLITVNIAFKAMEEYGKYCAEQALLYFNGNEVGHIEVNEWWSEFQRKEELE